MKKLFNTFFGLTFFCLILSSFSSVQADISDFENLKPDQKPKDLETDALEKLLKTLESKSARKEFISQLRTMIAAKTKAESEPAPLALSKISEIIHSISEKIIEFLSECEKTFAEILALFNDSSYRSEFIYAIKDIFLILGLGIIINRSIRWMGYYAYKHLNNSSHFTKLSNKKIRIIQRIISGFAIISMTIAMFTFASNSSLKGMMVPITFLLMISLVSYESSLFLFQLIFSPKWKELRLIKINDSTALLSYRYLRLVTFLMVVGITLSELILLLKGPTIFYSFVIKSMLFIACFKTLWFIYVMRNRVSQWLLRQEQSVNRQKPFSSTVARSWHVWASLYVCLFGITTFFQRINNVKTVAFSFIGTAFLITISYVLVLKIPKFVRTFMGHVTHHLPHIAPRKGFYTIFFSLLISLSIIFSLLFLSLEIWDLEVFDFFSEIEGLPSAFLNILLIFILSIFVWETNEYIIDRLFNRSAKHQRGTAKKQRLLTIKPLVQNTTRFILFALVALIIFAELNLDITPLLAGVGVIGIAFSFGSQSLVKDIITGIFILVEDTINVGDIVQIDGQNGNVEAISLRTVRLRDSEGNLHTIPFSGITKITNMSKNFSYYLFQIGISYSENIDRAFEAMKEVDLELRQDARYDAMILEPLEIMGVDKFTETGVILQARIKTLPDKSRWIVGREFNRRLKINFNRQKIEFAYEQKVYKLILSPEIPLISKS
ncbi:MAG: mechanosensitive ion channel [Candidatus Paracaedimonas acanthamoebae]|uniref:Mechanosensitive ion channel n=1 Tax=Candidatus Paracaedimonas acanthamoebae TaxID=244581 RepID=A0A8J7PMT3_9PROT|nr:mechanosensitive ion channel [Candidatus Paracaedimonas acanthamoebae]